MNGEVRPTATDASHGLRARAVRRLARSPGRPGLAHSGTMAVGVRSTPSASPRLMLAQRFVAEPIAAGHRRPAGHPHARDGRSRTS